MPFSLPSPLVLLSSRNSATMVTWRHTSVLLTGSWVLTDLGIRGSKNELVCENVVTGEQGKLPAPRRGYRLLCGVFHRESWTATSSFSPNPRAGYREYGPHDHHFKKEKNCGRFIDRQRKGVGVGKTTMSVNRLDRLCRSGRMLSAEICIILSIL